MAGLKKRSPRLKVTTDANNVTKIAPDHPDLGIAQLALMKAIGTSDSDFSNGPDLSTCRREHEAERATVPSAGRERG
jgi:hypothetical protein